MSHVRAAGDHTALILMKGPVADATIEALEDSGQETRVVDEDTFWKIYRDTDIHVSLDLVEEFLGSPVDMPTWLVGMSSFIGYIQTDERNLWVQLDRGAGVEEAEPIEVAS